MIFSISYMIGESSEYKYFENFKELEVFMMKCIEVKQEEFNYFDVYVYYGKEEERIRKQMEGAKA